MAISQFTKQDNYWGNFEITDEDLEFIYNHLLEIETPLTTNDIVNVLIQERIRQETERISKQYGEGGNVYLPKNHYGLEQKVSFPALDWQVGNVVGIRSGNNPDIHSFDVIQVKMDDGSIREFAAGLNEHTLNIQISPETILDPAMDKIFVQGNYGKLIAKKLVEVLEASSDLVRIAGYWFPRSLLVDVNIGHLNLAEAVLEMEGGGPLKTADLIEQIDLPTDVNSKLTEFSLNLALQEDERFDEVGPSGETLWFLNRLEPDEVRQPPVYLRYQPANIDLSSISSSLKDLYKLVYDELEPEEEKESDRSEITVSLIYPHWRAGTIPLSNQLAKLFPTAYEAPRVKFTFIDGETGKTYPGWVVRPYRYVYGLREWYIEKDIIPGSLFQIQQGKKAGEVILQAYKKRPTKEWIRTVLMGADGGLVFSLLKQQISNEIDERMVIAISDVNALDKIWETGARSRVPVEKIVMNSLRELIKLNPQGHAHAQELYATVNLIRRCPPGTILGVLANNPQVTHLGDLYFRLKDVQQEDSPYE